MRHSRAGTTLDIYEPFVPESQKAVVERLSLIKYRELDPFGPGARPTLTLGEVAGDALNRRSQPLRPLWFLIFRQSPAT